MDRSELSTTIRHEMGVLFRDALLAAAPTLLTTDLDGVEYCLQGLSRQVLVARAAATSSVRPAGEQCGRPTRRAARRPTTPGGARSA